MSSLPRQRTFLGHPIGLYVLFFTEMWERFSYYGMRALLILYMVKYYKWAQDDASTVYKWYSSLVYLTPILGGFLADRYLGNKKAVIIGAILMSIGHFLMAFEPYAAFYSALVFLILGNGMFKPNMSTQVGRLYAPNDPRRDGAYTIFYMGINLGAFLSPLVCGWLAANTVWKYHAGFTAAGIGMVLGLLTYVFGLPWVREIAAGASPPPAEVAAAPPLAQTPDLPASPLPDRPMSEAEAELAPSAVPVFNRTAPVLFLALAALMAVVAPVLAFTKLLPWDSAVGLWIAAGCAVIAAWITSRVVGAVRDRVLAIFLLGFFVVCYWAAAEQAGNALNLWADQTTDRYLTAPAPPVPAPPAEQPPADAGWLTFLNPVPTAWFQSINAFAIFVLGPVFAFLWIWLDRRFLNPNIPIKITLGVLLMALSFVFMLLAANREDQPSSVPYAPTTLPAGIEEHDGKLRPATPEGKEPQSWYFAGRLTHDASGKAFRLRGVLPDTERDRLVRDTAPQSFQEIAGLLGKITPELRKGEEKEIKIKVKDKLTIDPAAWLPDAGVKYDREGGKLTLRAALPLKVRLIAVPPGFNFALAELKKEVATYDEKTHVLTVHDELADKDVKGLLVAAGEPTFRTAMFDLYRASAEFRVSAWWLFWFYIAATLGELCLSPVGLSMVSKLAPVKYATMLMGLWLLTSFFGNFLAGMAGENYDKFPPWDYFLTLLVALGAVTAVGFLVARKVNSMMHGVK